MEKVNIIAWSGIIVAIGGFFWMLVIVIPYVFVPVLIMGIAVLFIAVKRDKQRNNED